MEESAESLESYVNSWNRQYSFDNGPGFTYSVVEGGGYPIDNGTLANIRDYTNATLRSTAQQTEILMRMEMHLANISYSLEKLGDQQGREP